ncbi:hypothetical protein GQ43DRAFT_498185 [Delitschia confertaspora ATCC 74209]|uniref:Uncharacterized protein n=1 Tax=Delitschia confertaspora ATCC 74209 TaxID=1513339 RepID=A0A9P4JUN4_9PLEO|nr:hypothetical protein GQ43DRAFT_498185 [Delitschia confertaspora ATCC 74209]
MPVNWTAENDRILFLTLIATHKVTVNYAAIAEAWPSSAGEKPTKRAVSERLVRLRKMVDMPASGGSTSPVKVDVTTPKKTLANAAATTPISKSKKRKVKKKVSETEESDADAHMTLESDDEASPKKVAKGNRLAAGLAGIGSPLKHNPQVHSGMGGTIDGAGNSQNDEATSMSTAPQFPLSTRTRTPRKASVGVTKYLARIKEEPKDSDEEGRDVGMGRPAIGSEFSDDADDGDYV